MKKKIPVRTMERYVRKMGKDGENCLAGTGVVTAGEERKNKAEGDRPTAHLGPNLA